MVTQIARTVARALQLNEDLTEAIGLGHDLGHTPFGHDGERALAALSPHGFTHYKQSLRVVDFLEEGGLNLTYEDVYKRQLSGFSDLHSSCRNKGTLKRQRWKVSRPDGRKKRYRQHQ